MKSAPYSKEEAEAMVQSINKLSGQPLYRGMDIVINSAFAFPYEAHQSLIDLFGNFSGTGRSLTDILSDRKEQYTLFDVALLYSEADDDSPMCQSIGIFSEQLRDRIK